MKLIRFRAKHLFSLGEIDLNLEGRGLTLVTGYSKDEGSSNGAGKSSLANKGLLWTLFGETAGGIKGDGVGNRHATKGTYGEVLFHGADGRLYTIRRERPASLSLSREGVDISAKIAKDTQDQIDKALGIDFKTFLQTSFFGQGRSLSYASLTPKDQKAVLEQILPMEEVDKWAQYADLKLKETSKLLGDAERVVQTAQVRLSTLMEEKVDTGRRADRWSQNKLDTIKRFEDEFANIDGKYARDWTTLEVEKAQFSQVDHEAWEKKISESILNLDKEYEDNNITLQEANQSVRAWQNAYYQRATKINRLNDVKGICSECQRPYTDFSEQDHKALLHEARTMLDESEANIRMAKEAESHYAKVCMEIKAKIKKNSLDHEACSTSWHQKEMHGQRVAALQDKINTDKVNYLQNIENMKGAENPFSSQISAFDFKIEQAKTEWTEANLALAALNGEVEHLTYWRDVYAKELKLKLFEDACPFLDARVNYHLGRLNNGQLQVKFSTIKRLANGSAKEEFNVHVESKTGGSGFDSLSGGEQQMVSFSIGLGLADLAGRTSSGRSNLLVLDEPFTELDERNSDSIVTYLNSEVNNGKDTILLISNDESLKGLIANRIHAVKEHGVTHVE